MKNDGPAPRPALSDEEIQDRIARGLDRGAGAALETLRRRAGLLGVKKQALERQIERTRKQPDRAAEGRLDALASRLEGLRTAARAAELEAGLARVRGGLATFPAGLAGAFGRVTDQTRRGRGGVSLAIVTADGKTVAQTSTSGDGYFSIQAPRPEEGELQLQVAIEPAPRTFRLTSGGRPLPLRRLLIETAAQESTRKAEPPRTETEIKTPTRPPTRKSPPSKKR